MDLFNKTFFRLAFGFIGIITVSVCMIYVANTLRQAQEGPCDNCAMTQ